MKSNSLTYLCPENEFKKIIMDSTSFQEVARKLGYKSYSGGTAKLLKKRVEELNISIGHFHLHTEDRVNRNVQNVFVQNSTVAQATLRRWYLKGEYSPYICSICGLEPEWQGKPLSLILDHINGDNHDDRIENLRWVCPNCNAQLPTTGSKNVKKRIYVRNPCFCNDCGKEISYGATRCPECYQKTIQDKPVTREELKLLIRTTPFSVIGARFNVTDNAIRKWCDSYNLPRRKKDIIAYSDIEWEQI